MKLKKGDKVIQATKKAYEVIYKDQGFRPLEVVLKEEKEQKELEELRNQAKALEVEGYNDMDKDELRVSIKKAQVAIEKAKEEQARLDKMAELEELKVEDLTEKAKELEIKGYSKMNKEELIAAIMEKE